jgi:co-chaperonin GroES (HSP10)
MSKAWAKVGDHVMFGKYAGHRFKYGDAELRIMNDDEILGLVPNVKKVT